MATLGTWLVYLLLLPTLMVLWSLLMSLLLLPPALPTPQLAQALRWR